MATVSAASSLAPFLSKTYDMVDDPQTDDVVSWSDTNDAIVVWDVRDFTRKLLPKFFKHNNFSSFVRQLNTYGFRKVHPDRWEFANDGFRKGHKHLLKSISRRKPSHSQGQEQPSQVKSTSGGSPVKAKNDGIEEEVEKLKTDKNVLVQELVRLRQQQQLTDHQFQNVGQRVHVMEQHQQQMMSFLAKAMQNPGFIAQLFHQPSESKSPKSGGNNKNKKRRFPNPEEENLTRKLGIGDGQIVEYQPLMNEAAMAMLQQILKMSASGRIETKINNINGFLMDNMDPPSNMLDKGSSPSQISGVTLPMALPTIQCSPRSANGQARGTQCPETDVPLLGSPQAGGVNAVKVDLPDDPFKPTESGHMMHMDAIPGSVDGPTPDLDVDVMVDEFPKLPGINDVFWEQFLSSSPVSGETNEIDYSMLGGGLGKELDQETEEEDESDKMQNISSLTKEMGLLASASHSG